MKIFLYFFAIVQMQWTLSASQSVENNHHSVARRWNELLLESIRNDFARPVVHARNLFHISAAMWDAWAVWESDIDSNESNTIRGTAGNRSGPSPWLINARNSGDEDTDTSASWDREAARRASISYAAYGILQWRFASSPGFAVMAPRYDDLMVELGYSPDFESAVGNDPRAVGNRIANAYIQFGLDDGSNEANDYANQYYRPLNAPLFPEESGTNAIGTPDRWQPLSLQTFIDQSGHTRPYGEYPAFLGPEWGNVSPFSLREDQKTTYVNEFGHAYNTYLDPGPPPMLNLNSETDGGGNNSGAKASEEERLRFLRGFEQVLLWSNHHDPTDGVEVDVSPNSIGNARLPTDLTTDYSWFYDAENGGDVGQGYTRNPVTGFRYQEQRVPRADYARILAEFWADGPDSETPPGHWFTLLNDVIDDIPESEKRIGGSGPVVNPLEYDVKAYFALGGGMHDAAIAAWGLKGKYDYVRPISVIRWMGENGQRTTRSHASYHPYGLELVPGVVEIITFESTRDGERHEHLKDSIGEIAVHCWRGPDYIEDEATDVAGCGWILAVNWWPYQRPTFVTPNFAGYVSGHSTFSRTAAEILTSLTGSPYFPGGLGQYVAPAGEFLVFEDGPSVDVRLQWVSYRDASDQCSLSRIWGGIHPSFDDIPGRLMGQIIGPQVWELGLSHFTGEAQPRAPSLESHENLMKALPSPKEAKKCPGDFNGDGRVDHNDVNIIYSMMGVYCPNNEPCDEDFDGDMYVGEKDLAAFFEAYVGSDCRVQNGLVRD